MSAVTSPQPAALPPSPTTVWRGSCTARCAHTGRRCALPTGHATPHASGRTRFVAVADAGATHFAGADALTYAAQRRLQGDEQ